MAVNNSAPLPRVAFVQSLFPDLKISSKAAPRLDTLIEYMVLRPIPHKTLPTAIFVRWKWIRHACCGNQSLEKKIKAHLLVRAPGYQREWYVGDAYHVNSEFRANYMAAIRTYEPARGSGIQVQQELSEHPFCPMVPVNIPHMQWARGELEKWLKYLDGDTKTKPKELRTIIDPIRKKEGRKVWAGEFAEGTDNHELCPLKTSPKERSHAKVEELMAGVVIMIDIAINNDGCIPMNYRQSKNCPRWYSTGGMRSLQSCTKALRIICMHGCIEYDIVSTNQTIAMDYAIANNLPHDELRCLIEHKQKCYSKLHKATKLPLDTVKTILLALGNSAPLVAPEHARKLMWKLRFKHEALQSFQIPNAVLGAIWDESRYRVADCLMRYNALQNNSFIQGYVAEMAAIEQHLKQSGKSKSLFGYAYQVEVAAMTAMYQAMPSALISTFDAVVCANAEDCQLAETAMYDATGVPFKLKEIPYD